MYARNGPLTLNFRALFFRKDTHREKSNLKLNFSAYEKSEYGYLGRWYIKLTLFNEEVLKLKQIFQKNKVITDKTPLFVIGPFCSRHSVCLSIGF